MSGIRLDTRDAAGNKTKQGPCHHGTYGLLRDLCTPAARLPSFTAPWATVVKKRLLTKRKNIKTEEKQNHRFYTRVEPYRSAFGP